MAMLVKLVRDGILGGGSTGAEVDVVVFGNLWGVN